MSSIYENSYTRLVFSNILNLCNIKVIDEGFVVIIWLCKSCAWYKEWCKWTCFCCIVRSRALVLEKRKNPTYSSFHVEGMLMLKSSYSCLLNDRQGIVITTSLAWYLPKGEKKKNKERRRTCRFDCLGMNYVKLNFDGYLERFKFNRLMRLLLYLKVILS